MVAEEDIVEPHPHLAAETVLLVSVMADNSLLDLLSALVADCFMQSRGIAISQSTLESQCAAMGKSDSLPVLGRISSLLPLLALDRAILYRYIGIVKYQVFTRGLRWLYPALLRFSYLRNRFPDLWASALRLP